LGVETLIKKIGGKKFATPATASAGVLGSPSPVPACRACSPHSGRRWTRMVFISLQRGVSSIVFFINEFLSKFFLTRLMSAAASATARHCRTPDPARQTCSPHHRRRRVRWVCFNLRRGGCFGRTKGDPSKKIERDGDKVLGDRHFLTLCNNQPKDGYRDGWGVLERVRDRGGKRGRGRFIIVWGNGINDRKNRKLIMSWP
jgi:hypothetical protein